MKFIARHLNLIGLLLLASFASAAAALYFQVPERIQTARATTTPAVRFACPMHPNLTSSTPADCSECGMKLIAIGNATTEPATGAHKSGCCAEKPVVEAAPVALSCPHLAAQAAQVTQTPPADACCSKPANP